MMLFTFVAAVAALLPLCRAAPQVKLGSSTLTGTQNTGLTEFFGGIPYAEPPTGERRFAAPVLKTDPGVASFDATKYGTTCPLSSATNPNEDCLKINVVRPIGSTSNTMLPVLVWIYGGGFQFGDASQYDGSGLTVYAINRGTPLVFVNFNYRLGVLGFPQGQEAASQGALNLGLRDMLTALEWVQKNIAAFGGDPSKVTVFGQSAGSVALAHLFLNSKLENLARAAIFESGAQSTLPVMTGTYRDANWKNVVAAVPECASAGTSNTFDCLRKASAATLMSAQKTAQGKAGEQFPWIPVIDRDIIPDLPSKLLSAGKFSCLPFISGSTLDEGTQFATKTLSTDQQLTSFLSNFITPLQTGTASPALQTAIGKLLQLYPNDPAEGSPYGTGSETFGLGSQYKRAAAIAGDIWFHSARRAWDQAAAKQGVKVFAYLFADLSSVKDATLGIAHGNELGYLFSQPQAEPAHTLSAVMRDYWISFATSLNPNDGKGSSRPQWQQYTSSSENIMQFQGSNTTMIPDTYRAQQIAFINSDPTIFNH